MGIFFRFHGSSGPMCQEQSILFFVFSLLQSVPPDLNYLISHCIPTFVWIGKYNLKRRWYLALLSLINAFGIRNGGIFDRDIATNHHVIKQLAFVVCFPD